MTGARVKVNILLCTFRRPEVRETLQSLCDLAGTEELELKVVVSDNDDKPSGKVTVESFAASTPTPITYLHAPARNISIARNTGLDAATSNESDWIVFLDDDERADPNWLSQLLLCAAETQADAVFGPSIAEYDKDTPDWIQSSDYHSNRPVSRNGIVQTGYTCNALLRWNGTPWINERFDLSRGRSGGEDTEFFFRLWRAGANFEICETAIVREKVAQNRLTFKWLARRKYRSGQSYASVASDRLNRIKLGSLAVAKLTLCVFLALPGFFSQSWRNKWLLRGLLHAGVFSGCLSFRQSDHYGSGA